MTQFNRGDRVRILTGPGAGGFGDVVWTEGVQVRVRRASGFDSLYRTDEIEAAVDSDTRVKALRQKYAKSHVPAAGATAWVIWDGEEYWSPSGWVEEGSDSARYFPSKEQATASLRTLQDGGKLKRNAQVIAILG